MRELHAFTVKGPLSGEEGRAILMLREAGRTLADIGRELNRHHIGIRNFLKLHDAAMARAAAQREAAATVLQQQDSVAGAEKADIDTVSSLWTLGLSPYSILGRVNRARRAAGRPTMQAQELHEIVLRHELKRPEPIRPKVAA